MTTKQWVEMTKILDGQRVKLFIKGGVKIVNGVVEGNGTMDAGGKDLDCMLIEMENGFGVQTWVPFDAIESITVDL